jgi:hypothetical protein
MLADALQKRGAGGFACQAVAILILLAPGCRDREKITVGQTEEEALRLASVVHVADPRSASQLVSGFYDIEQNAWRWTAGQFTVLLRPPRNAVQKGAVLKLKFSVPEPVLAKLKTISLSASLGGLDLSPETYTQAGEFTYSRDVSGAVLAGDAVKVDFSLDKSLPPNAVDQRELGVIVSNVGLEPK